jgi:hypothetical protein
MKFATFAHGGRDHIGIVDEATRLVHAIAAASGMLDLIERYDALKSGLKPEAPGFRSPRFSSRRRSRCRGATSSASARTIASTPGNSPNPASRPAR